MKRSSAILLIVIQIFATAFVGYFALGIFAKPNDGYQGMATSFVGLPITFAQFIILAVVDVLTNDLESGLRRQLRLLSLGLAIASLLLALVPAML